MCCDSKLPLHLVSIRWPATRGARVCVDADSKHLPKGLRFPSFVCGFARCLVQDELKSRKRRKQREEEEMFTICDRLQSGDEAEYDDVIAPYKSQVTQKAMDTYRQQVRRRA